MKIKYQIFKEKACLVQKYFGEWSTEYYKDYLQTLVKESEWEYDMKGFPDFREANSRLINKDFDYILKLKKSCILCFAIFRVSKPKASDKLFNILS